MDRQCRICLEVKDTSGFYLRRGKFTNKVCKKCKSKQVVKRQKELGEVRLKYKREYRATMHVKNKIVPEVRIVTAVILKSPKFDSKAYDDKKILENSEQRINNRSYLKNLTITESLLIGVSYDLHSKPKS